MTQETPAQQMACMEVWGGNRLANHETAFSGLDVWVHSRPHGQSRQGGDVVHASNCATGRITRLLLADVAGHGGTVAATGVALGVLMRRFVNYLDQSELVRQLNRQFAGLAAQSAFATALVATYFAPTRRLTISNAGHPRPLIYRAAVGAWHPLAEGPAAPGLRNVPLGLFDTADFDTIDITLEPGDLVLAYSDALPESPGSDGHMVGEDGILAAVRDIGSEAPARLIPALLADLRRRHPAGLADDDLTVMLVRATGVRRSHGMGARLRAFGRLCAALLGALRPGAERPPLPDAVLANIGGAILPGLERRWMAPRSGQP